MLRSVSGPVKCQPGMFVFGLGWGIRAGYDPVKFTGFTNSGLVKRFLHELVELFEVVLEVMLEATGWHISAKITDNI